MSSIPPNTSHSFLEIVYGIKEYPGSSDGSFDPLAYLPESPKSALSLEGRVSLLVEGSCQSPEPSIPEALSSISVSIRPPKRTLEAREREGETVIPIAKRVGRKKFSEESSSASKETKQTKSDTRVFSTTSAWTKAELAILHENPGLSPTDILLRGLLPGRSRESIRQRKFLEGISNTQYRIPWTPEDRKIFREHMDLGPMELQKRFFPDRTLRAIAHRVTRARKGEDGEKKMIRGTRKCQKMWSENEKKIVLKHLDLSLAEICEKKVLPGRSSVSIKSFLERLSYAAKKNPPTRPFTTEEGALLEEHRTVLPSLLIERGLFPGRSEGELYYEKIRNRYPFIDGEHRTDE